MRNFLSPPLPSKDYDSSGTKHPAFVANACETRATLNIKSKTRTLQLEWSPDERRLAVKHNYGGERIQIWDLRTTRLQATLATGNDDAALIMAWSPDAGTLLTSGYHGKAMLWDAQTGSLRATLIQDPPCPKQSFLKKMAAIKRCAGPGWVKAYFVADGGVLTLSSENSPKLWDKTGRLKMDLPLTQEKPEQQYFTYPTDAVLSPDKQLVARYDANGLVLLRTSTGEVHSSFGDIGEPLEFSPDGRQILVIKRDSTTRQPCFQVRCDLQIYDVVSGRLQVTFGKMSGDVERYWSPNGAAIVTVSGTLLDTRDGRVAHLPYEACTPDRMIGSPQCDRFVFNSDGRMLLKLKDPLKLWNAKTGQLLTQIEGAMAPAAFSPTDNGLLVTRGTNKKVALIWRVEL